MLSSFIFVESLVELNNIPAMDIFGPKQQSDYDHEEEDEDGDEPENGKMEEVKKVKQNKPKVTVAEAAAKIDAVDLATFLVEISVGHLTFLMGCESPTITSYESQQDIQMMQFADYFGRAFSTVSSSQFPWMKLLRESTVAKMADSSFTCSEAYLRDFLETEEGIVLDLWIRNSQLKTVDAPNKLILAPLIRSCFPLFFLLPAPIWDSFLLISPSLFWVKHTKEWLRTAKLTLIVHMRLIHTMNAPKLA
ncbi:hypothetical protein K1719_005429 [Acacia pycnantha]|nr:hypothetical protein K1719_005429 [Acacia pycnantha]